VQVKDHPVRAWRSGWAPRAFQEFARHHDLGAVSAEGYPWIEIDFRTDYERAVREIAPRIAEHDALD
jgi:choline kinase